ncbi:hypothetical protein DFP72DRAFT_440154 [Ephemerocybe angulata]|uniref:Nephrocystin 3-like N-terminal domain-containing protein n=1 Tax=Ephemerocybe angulata TaxID=980116 RepID=A0A8H6M341_9AGAR|nr:hypothetical protein DFP72DRAFT_440154 [Tulosesus angulatus]
MTSQTNQGGRFFEGANQFNVDQQTNIGELRIGHQGDVHNHYLRSNGLEDLNPIPDASYTRNRQTSPPDSNCLPGTRLEVIDKIASWADPSTLLNPSNPHVMWLYGYVGCGKSAIAQAVAEKYARKGRLAASFFFFRGSGDRSRTGRLAATIASQIAAAIPATAPVIEAALRAHVNLLHSTTSITEQFQRLVYDPIHAIRWGRMGLDRLRGPYIIVIDGLDECDERNEVKLLIDHMLDFFQQHPRIPLRIFITSRVEEHIRTRLDPTHVFLVDLVNHTSSDDIEAAMRMLFTLAAKHDRCLRAHGEWPSRGDLRQLARQSGSSYIFMMTIFKFILDPGDPRTPMDRLPLALSIDHGLDGLYSQTLSRAEYLPHFSNIVGVITQTQIPLSIVEVSETLGIDTVAVVRVLVNLHAILQVPGDDVTAITLCHSSLYDFLTQENRSGRFYVGSSPHIYLAYWCMKQVADAIVIPEGRIPGIFRTSLTHHLRSIYTGEKDGGNASADLYTTQVVVSHARVLFPSRLPLVLATYLLLKGPNGPTYAMLLNLRSPLVPTEIIMDTLDCLTQACQFDARPHLRTIWQTMKPAFSPIRSFYYNLVKIGMSWIVRMSNGGLSGSTHWQFRPQSNGIGTSAFTIFDTFLISWPSHLVQVLDSFDSPEAANYGYHISAISGMGVRKDDGFRQDMLPGDVLTVGSAYRRLLFLPKDGRSHRNQTKLRNIWLHHVDIIGSWANETLKQYADPTVCDWGWNDGNFWTGREMVFQTQDSRSWLTIFDIIAGFVSLATCVKGECPSNHYCYFREHQKGRQV